MLDQTMGNRSRLLLACMLVAGVSVSGCGGSTPASKSPSGSVASKGKRRPSEKEQSADPAKTEAPPKPKFDAVTLGGDGDSAKTGSKARAATESEQMESVVHAMQPLQIMLGKWRGTTNQKFKGFSAVEELEWIWDFRSNRAQPALIVTSEKSPYIREGRLTYLPEANLFQFSVKAPDGRDHVMRGTFEREPEEFTGDDNKPQRSYKLVLTETQPEGNEAWQVAFDQQENNRYLVQLSRKRGTAAFQLADTVGTQRLGTSFAASDEDYGDKKCIISGGLGVSTVSYNGKSYWVCCSGCQAAFNEDPKRWVAKMEEADKAKANKN